MRYEKSADGVAIFMNVPALWLAQLSARLREGRWPTLLLRGLCREVPWLSSRRVHCDHACESPQALGPGCLQTDARRSTRNVNWKRDQCARPATGEKKTTHVEPHRACLQLVVRVLEFHFDLCLLHERLHLAKLCPLGHPFENAS